MIIFPFLFQIFTEDIKTYITENKDKRILKKMNSLFVSLINLIVFGVG